MFSSFGKPTWNGKRSVEISAEEVNRSIGNDGDIGKVNETTKQTETKQIKNEVCKKDDKCEDSEDSSEPVIYKKYF